MPQLSGPGSPGGQTPAQSTSPRRLFFHVSDKLSRSPDGMKPTYLGPHVYIATYIDSFVWINILWYHVGS